MSIIIHPKAGSIYLANRIYLVGSSSSSAYNKMLHHTWGDLFQETDPNTFEMNGISIKYKIEFNSAISVIWRGFSKKRFQSAISTSIVFYTRLLPFKDRPQAAIQKSQHTVVELDLVGKV